MGMFDQIRVTRAMPDGYQSSDWYQTKSMECLLVDYEIDDNDQLWELGVCTRPDPDGKQRIEVFNPCDGSDDQKTPTAILFNDQQ